ncbi:hypothetical protein GJAV_G00086220, partial [Gymnothorax javanicus]
LKRPSLKTPAVCEQEWELFGVMMMMMMKMKMWVLPLLVGLCFQSGSPSPVAPLTCETPEVLKNAKLALNEINADRQEGYIFALNRVHRVRQKGKMTAQALQVIDGRVYFLHIDVLETKCHVLSRKNLTECPIRDIDDVPKYGRCIAVISAYDGRKNVVLHTYKCTIQEVPPMAVTGTCPDCPFSVSLDHPGIQKAVETSLQKFNDVNNLNKLLCSSQCDEGVNAVGCRSDLLCGIHHSGDSVLEGNAWRKCVPVQSDGL